MSRLGRSVLLAAVVVTLLQPATAAGGSPRALPAAPGGSVVLAVEGATATPGGEPTETEPPGLEPAGPNVSGNPAAPQEYEANFLWGAAVGLLVLSVLGIAGLTGLYWLLVVRPRRQSEEE